jgi:hypothetical protein
MQWEFIKSRLYRRRGTGRSPSRHLNLALLFTAAFAAHARAASIGDVFVIAEENHNFTQPTSDMSPEQLFGNPAAPYLNSLITPGNPNAQDVSYASNYTNTGNGVHPSEPNYLWAEAGTNYNSATGTTVLSDNDPSAGSGNIFTNTPHLTALMNAAGISWQNYQEDYQISGKGPLVSASGTLPGGATNSYNGSTLYSYAVKHNPMAFFTDSDTENLAPLSALSTNLADNTVARFNWITPDLYNEMHSALPSGFTYKGTHYTGDQSAVAAGDNFLSIVVPQIEASQAFKNNGLIIIQSDETEGGDTSSYTIPEILISPLARGNAFDSTVALNHSSDLKTMQEIFQLGSTFLSNSIPTSEYNVNGPGNFSTVANSNDLSSLFAPGTIPAALPEPTSTALLTLVGMSVLARRRQRAQITANT